MLKGWFDGLRRSHARIGRACLLGILSGLLLVGPGCDRSAKHAATTAPITPAASDESELLRLRNVALAYLEAERYPDATAAFDELIRRIPDEPMVYANRALIALRQGKYEEAAPFLEKAGRLAPDNPDIAVLRAAAADSGGGGKTARAILAHAVSKNPDHLRVRWALVDRLRRGPPGEDRDAALRHLNALLERAPRNVIVRLALARELLERGDIKSVRKHLAVLEASGIIVTPQARRILQEAKARVKEGNAKLARALVIALDNVLKPSRASQTSLVELKGPPVSVAEPLWKFLVHRVSEPSTGPHPLAVTYEDVGTRLGLSDVRAVAARMVFTDAATSPAFVGVVGKQIEIRRRNASGRYERTGSFALKASSEGSAASVARILAVDWNNDSRLDLVCGLTDGSARLCLQGADGHWQAASGRPLLPPVGKTTALRVLLPWDADHDGDLDLLVGRDGVRATLLRNNGDGTCTDVAVDLGIAHEADAALIDAAIGDLDEDGDLDLMLVDAWRSVVRLDNERSGRFVRVEPEVTTDPVDGLAVADFDNDGWLDVAVVLTDGACQIGANQQGDSFTFRTVAAMEGGAGHAIQLRPLDFDNDGWLDLVVLAAGRLHLLRNAGGLTFATVEKGLPPQAGNVGDVQVVDYDRDGDLDLLVTSSSGCSVWDNNGADAHGWQDVQLRAIVEGGQRNNAFGLGGFIELRAGRAYQKRRVDGPVTHFGLGMFGPAEAIRVVWPNGVPQNIIRPEPNQLITEKQMLKGSCPFLLAYDGQAFEFVTDLLWRSPLGMKINAQHVASIVTTQDYVKIEGRQLRPREGRYDVAITAALWETIFVDAVELWAVDHPADVEVFVDERFVAPIPPPFEIHVVDALRTPVSAVDDRGRDVLDRIRDRDGRRLGGFGKGRYQGIAAMHHVDLDLGPWSEPQTVKLIASGWIMPTDTSLNVAISQGHAAQPRPLCVAVADGKGGWIEVIPNAGFPAGKLKTIVLDLSGRFPTRDHHVRLATNLEIYWDRIACSVGAPSFSARPVPLAIRRAELDRIGFPTMRRADPLAPELPDYTSPTQMPRWRDLHGYYTRYGDVRELLADTDDRYVIMNAGDRIGLSFEAGPSPRDGWTRDFILFSDGWVKDGDLNTVASKTVAPLPHHHMSGYPYPDAETPSALRPDHPDRLRYHTRFITSDAFRDRMRP